MQPVAAEEARLNAAEVGDRDNQHAVGVEHGTDARGVTGGIRDMLHDVPQSHTAIRSTGRGVFERAEDRLDLSVFGRMNFDAGRGPAGAGGRAWNGCARLNRWDPGHAP